MAGGPGATRPRGVSSRHRDVGRTRPAAAPPPLSRAPAPAEAPARRRAPCPRRAARVHRVARRLLRRVRLRRVGRRRGRRLARAVAGGSGRGGRRRQGRHVPRQLRAPVLRPGAGAQATRCDLEGPHRQRQERPASMTTTRPASGPAAAGPASPTSSRRGQDYLLTGAYDHKLRKIDAQTGKVVWGYSSTTSSRAARRCSQPGPTGRATGTSSSRVRGAAPLRSSTTRRWRLTARRGVRHRQGAVAAAGAPDQSYSRDCDGSGFFYDGACTSGVESGWFYALDPLKTQPWSGYRTPMIERQRLLLGDGDATRNHGDNLVLEASAGALGENHLHRLRRRPRLRPAAQRPQGRLGLLHRLGPRRHAGATAEGKLLPASRSSTSRVTAACCA